MASRSELCICQNTKSFDVLSVEQCKHSSKFIKNPHEKTRLVSEMIPRSYDALH